MLGDSSDAVHQYTLTTAFDISTARYDAVSFFVSAQDTTPRSLSFNPDGTKMYMFGNSSDAVYQYDIGSGGAPQYRVCENQSCSIVRYDWRNTSDVLVSSSDFIELRLNSSAATEATTFVTVEVGNLSDGWDVTTE